MDVILEKLFELRDEKYKDFQAKLIPAAAPDTIIGVRTPELRKLASQLVQTHGEEVRKWLGELPHRYFDENQLHAFVISGIKNFDECMSEVQRFLPYVDNWATCDQLSPAVFKKHTKEVAEAAETWMRSGKTYIVRFGIGMIMQYFLDDRFDAKYLEAVASVRSDDYYVNMMIAWFFATALAKQYESALPYVEERRLDVFTHNKTVQKAIESYRLTDDQKSYLRSLRIR